jgi:hypothetical protein
MNLTNTKQLFLNYFLVENAGANIKAQKQKETANPFKNNPQVEGISAKPDVSIANMVTTNNIDKFFFITN